MAVDERRGADVICQRRPWFDPPGAKTGPVVRVLITGAAGQLGRALADTAPPEIAVTALDKAQLDVTVQEAARAEFARRNPDVIVNTAAYTAVDRAESEPVKAYAVNAAGPAYLAQMARASGARLIHVSTDYVFDGNSDRPYRPNDRPAPLSVYGASNLRVKGVRSRSVPNGQ